MKLSSIWMTLALAASVPFVAQGAGRGEVSSKVKTDSLIVMDQDELVARLAEAVAQSRPHRQQSNGSALQLSDRDWELLRYQLLFNMLRSSGAPVSAPSGQNYDARLSHIEQLLSQLLQQKQGSTSIIVDTRKKQEPQLPLTSSLVASGDTVVLTDTVYQTETVLKPIGFKRQVFFAVGSSKLNSVAQSTLGDVVRMMKKDESLRLQLTGYASPEGNANLNARLSETRSKAVRAYLESKGIAGDRLFSVGAGVDAKSELPTVARRVDIELFR